MTLEEYTSHDATGLASLVDAGDITPLELTRLARQAYEQTNPSINAVIEFYDDAEVVPGCDAGLFHGVPFLRKDAGAAEAGRLQECGSRLLKGLRPQTGSHFFDRARRGGLRVIGRTALPEFGTSGMSESLLNGITQNPWSLGRSAGGSSSGAAAAVAAGIVPIAHASDGGGSIRIPAAWCGLVGLNPSRGRVSNGPKVQDSLFGFSRQFVLCRSVRDMAAALDVFSGSYPNDPFAAPEAKRPYLEEMSLPTGRLRVGIARTQWGAVEVEPEISQAVETTASLLEDMGHIVIDIRPPYDPSEKTRLWKIRSPHNARILGNDARSLNRRIDASTIEPINLKIYEHGRRNPVIPIEEIVESVRQFQNSVSELIDMFDVLLTPTMPVLPPSHGSMYSTTNPTLTAVEFMAADTALYQYLGVFNVTGHPSVSLPLAHSASGLPIGLQIVGRMGDEATLVRISRDLEEACPWHHRKPPLRAGA